ncbi:MAG: Omp28-related outer membrane protein [Saprospirales bacterium]|nr:Omp28-related outer membrane protein [Saprospirales bacterium]
MKYLLFGLILGLTLLSTSCHEIPPVINPFMGDPPDTTIDLENQMRQVLIEEFTGVRCVQCPAGSAEIASLLAIHGERLVAVSIHAGDFSYPFPQSHYNFQTSEGEELINFLGPPISYPSAVIDRTLFDGEADLILGRNDWAGYIAQEKAIDPVIKIAVVPNFNETTRKLDVEVKLYPQEDILDPDVRISLMLTESNIVDYQDTPDGKVDNYVHKHVLRDMLTSYLGEGISETLISGIIITKNFSYTVPEVWNAGETASNVEEMHVVVFVHLGTTTKEVLQAIEVPVIK